MSADAVNVGHLRALVERIERVEADIKDMNADKSGIYKEARGYGYDVKAIRAVVAKRKLDSTEREERDAIFGLYWDALNGVPRVHVHEAEEFNPETGEVIEDQPETETGSGRPAEAPLSKPAASLADEIARTNPHSSVDSSFLDKTDSAGTLMAASPSVPAANSISPEPSSQVQAKPDAGAAVSGANSDDVPDFIKRPADLAINERCEHPEKCKFSHHPHKLTCSTCSTAWAIAQRKKTPVAA